MTLKTLPVIQPSSSLTPFSSWLFLTRRRRILFLTLCSPLLLPLLCLSLPFLCLAHLYICLRRRCRSRRNVAGAGRLRRCEEGRKPGDEEEEEEREIGWILLQRYLDDQLGLVGSVVAVYNSGGDDEFIDCFPVGELSEVRRPLLL